MKRLHGLGLAALALVTMVAAGTAAQPVSGAIFTTTSTGGSVNANIYDAKQDVYLNGGPSRPGAAGLPDGAYYVQVTNPGGSVVLGTSVGSSNETPVTVTGGEFDELYQLWSILIAGSDGVLLTGCLNRRTHPWLVDHAVRGTVLLPGTAFLELAIRAGDEVGCDRVEELTLTTPLALPETGGVQVQLWIGRPDAEGRCTVTIHSRPEAGEDEPWTQHATGVLTSPARTAR